MQDDDLLAGADCRLAVGEEDERTALGEAGDRVVEEVLDLLVERAGGLLDDDDRGVVQEGAGQRLAALPSWARPSSSSLPATRIR